MVLSTKYGRTRDGLTRFGCESRWSAKCVGGVPEGGSLGGPWGVSAGPPRPPRNDPKQKVLIPFGINLKISVRDWKVSHTNKVQKLLLF